MNETPPIHLSKAVNPSNAPGVAQVNGVVCE